MGYRQFHVLSIVAFLIGLTFMAPSVVLLVRGSTPNSEFTLLALPWFPLGVLASGVGAHVKLLSERLDRLESKIEK